MNGTIKFSWRGEPIADIEAWARERNEPMVWLPEIRSGLAGLHVVLIRMPRSFADALPTFESNPLRSVQREILGEKLTASSGERAPVSLGRGSRCRREGLTCPT